MRGWGSEHGEHGTLFSCVRCRRVAKDHPLRAIRALALLSPEVEKLSARLGGPTIAPEQAAAGAFTARVLSGAFGAAAGPVFDQRPVNREMLV